MSTIAGRKSPCRASCALSTSAPRPQGKSVLWCARRCADGEQLVGVPKLPREPADSIGSLDHMSRIVDMSQQRHRLARSTSGRFTDGGPRLFVASLLQQP
jgi:hypothetical protein